MESVSAFAWNRCPPCHGISVRLRLESLSGLPWNTQCLDRAYTSSQKGGTLIAEDVQDLEAHERRLQTPDAYRPASCLRCSAKVHIHDLRPRRLLGDPRDSTEAIRFRCADRERCGATWQVLPAFLARHLWRSWPVVEKAVATPRSSAVPARTRRRWQSRLATAARLLIALLTTTTDEMLCGVATAVGLDASRHELVECYAEQIGRTEPGRGHCFAELASLFHRLAPGVRLM